MPGWDSYHAVYGAELRAAAREFADHGWPVVEESASALLLLTGRTLDVLEVPSSCGQAICAALRNAGLVVPVAATPTGSWWFPVTAGAEPPPELVAADDVVLHAAGDAVLAPPSQAPDGWVHWRVAPALSSYRLAPADMIFEAAADAVGWHTVGWHADHRSRQGAQRPAGVATVGTRL
jgi:hypothetical protein